MPAVLSKTPLLEAHLRLRAKIVPFAGWEMPLQYAGIIAEHRAVRTAWGIFDVSHMGRILLSGDEAPSFLHSAITSDVHGLSPWRARYGFICNEEGGIIDDVVALKEDLDTWTLVCNASNREAVADWLEHNLPHSRDLHIVDDTKDTVMIAAQGPQAIEGAGKALGTSLHGLKRFGGARIHWTGAPALVTRTGYTGEDGVEIVVHASIGMKLWDALLAAGATPCGLGARDTLRLEAGLPLHGNDISAETNPIEAGLERFVRAAGGYIGAEALEKVRQRGAARRLAGFRALERGVAPRHGHAILHGDSEVGEVTSGSFSPTLGVNIGMGYVPGTLAATGTRLSVDVRGTRVGVEVVPLPFYRRQT